MRLAVTALLAAAIALIVSQIVLRGSVWSLIPWGIGRLLVGFSMQNKKETLFAGAIYGFLISFLFMLMGYKGARPVVSVLPFFALLGLFGALCGLILSLLGFSMRKLLRK